LKHIFKKVFSPSWKIDKLLLKQEAMLKIALLEIGIDTKWVEIQVDHLNGYCKINGIVFELIFPKVHFFYCREALFKVPKTRRFYFDGYPGDDEGRKEMLFPFKGKDSLITFTDQGRRREYKGSLNEDYFTKIASSKFTLCPHQKDWPNPNSRIWTYRFVEACMGFSIPVVFNKTPLSKTFVDGFYYVFDDNISEGQNIQVDDYDAHLLRNFKLAEKRFTFQEEHVSKIWQTL
jgi:hypothetical protein